MPPIEIILPSATQIEQIRSKLQDIEQALDPIPDIENEIIQVQHILADIEQALDPLPSIRDEIVNSVEVMNISSRGLLRSDDTITYSEGDVVGFADPDSIEFSNVLPNAGDPFKILSARMRINEHDIGATPTQMDVPAGMSDFRIHIFNEEPIPVGDNEPFNLEYDDVGIYLGYITLSNVVSLGQVLFAQANNVNFVGRLSSEHINLYGIVQTMGSYEPIAETEYVFTLAIQRVKPAVITG